MGRLYKTAIIKNNIFTENGHNDLPAGTVVSVAYQFDAYNQLFKRKMAVYRVTLGDKVYGDFYENNLTDFVF